MMAATLSAMRFSIAVASIRTGGGVGGALGARGAGVLGTRRGGVGALAALFRELLRGGMI